MSEETCAAVSEIGNRCSRQAGHDSPSDKSIFSSKANPLHIARNSDGMVVQIWGEQPEDLAERQAAAKAGS